MYLVLMIKPACKVAVLASIALLFTACGEKPASNTLKVVGSTTVNLAAAEAADVLRDTKGMDITVDTQGGSSGGITAVGEGMADVGMASKPLSEKDRSRFPDVDLVVTRVGEDAVALVVSPDVWNGGVKSLSAQQMRDIYEKRVLNWSQVGGPDLPITFFNKEPGRGTWEVFAKWAYENPDDAPSVSHLEVGANEETRSKVSSTSGAMSQLSASWADGETVYALGVTNEEGNIIAPSSANIVNGSYPLSRPLNLITRGAPSGDAKVFVDFMLSDKGQVIVKKAGYLGNTDLK